MARVLLFDPDENHALGLAAALTLHGHAVTVRAKRSGVWEEDVAQFDVVVLDITTDDVEDWKLLSRWCQLFRNSRIPILCVSRVYRGPAAKLRAERMGVRLVYEH